MTEAVVLLTVAEAATITARFPEVKLAALTEGAPKEKSATQERAGAAKWEERDFATPDFRP